MLHRGTTLDELLEVPDGTVDLIYCTFDLLQNIQQQNLIQARSQLLDVQLGGWPFLWAFPGEEDPWLFTQGLC